MENAPVTSHEVENAKGRKIVTAEFFLEGKDGGMIDDVRSFGPASWICSLLPKYGYDNKQ